MLRNVSKRFNQTLVPTTFQESSIPSNGFQLNLEYGMNDEAPLFGELPRSSWRGSPRLLFRRGIPMQWPNALNETTYLDNTLTQWLSFLVLSCVLYFIVMTAFRFLVKRVEVYTKSTQRTWDDFITVCLKKTSKIFIAFVLFVASALILDFSDRSVAFFRNTMKVAIFFQAAIWGNELVALSLRRYLSRHSRQGQPVSEIHLSAYSAVSVTAKFLLWTVLFLLLLDNLGVNISALVTGLGIGGIAIALAVQNILGDIFASLTIILDKPFEVGDFIIVGDKMGTVESIGLKTSRISSLSGEQLVFPNKKLVESEIQNFKRMQTRRIVFSFGVVYDCSTEQLKLIPEIVKEIIGSIKEAKLDRAHLSKFSESSIDFEVVYIMQTADYNTYMDVQQSINLQLFDRFAAEEIEFSSPSRSVFIRSTERLGENLSTIRKAFSPAEPLGAN